MLKRLFVSLLILSALASEGVIHLPVNIYSLCFSSIQGFGISNGLFVPSEGVTEKNSGNALSQGGRLCGSFILSSNSVQKINTGLADISLDERDSTYLPYTTTPLAGFDQEKSSKQAILEKSDLSPPKL